MKRWLKIAATLNLSRASLISLVVAGLAGIVFSVSASADTVVNGFKSKSALQPGIIVAISEGGTDTVEANPGNEASRIYGVVIDPSQAPLTVRGQGQQTFVATAGTYPVFVSTQNGTIEPGDYISMSSVDGIGTKADQQPVIIGRAIESFSGTTKVITTTPTGQLVGRIQVAITPGKNPLVKDDKIAIPAPLKRFSESIAGKNVSAARVYAALAVFVITALIVVVVLWVGIRSGMISIGRNPLSHRSIMASLIQVIVTAILIFVVGMVGVYLLLRL